MCHRRQNQVFGVVAPASSVVVAVDTVASGAAGLSGAAIVPKVEAPSSISQGPTEGATDKNRKKSALEELAKVLQPATDTENEVSEETLTPSQRAIAGPSGIRSLTREYIGMLINCLSRL